LLTTHNSQLTTEIAKRFPDLHPALDGQQAVVEANRCLNCFDAPCTSACPTHIDVPGFIKRIASGNLRGSATKILEANVLAESCSRVCPVEVLCEGACVMHHYNRKPIEIGRLQRFAMESFYASGGSIPVRGAAERKEKIACIGAGPASLACAAELRLQGFQVTVFEKRALPGGLNTYGVAEYKLRAADSLHEIEMIRGLGVEFRAAEIADAASLEALEREFEVIFLGVGLGAMHRLEIPGGEHPAVVDALEFIAAYKVGSDPTTSGTLASPPVARSGALRMGHPQFLPMTGVQSVVVIGAGNTAIDAAVAAVRLGAPDVKILYRRDAKSMSAFGFEFEHAKHEGVEFVWWTLPRMLETDEAGALEALTCVRTQLNERAELVAIEGSEFAVACDMVIPAIGQSPLLEFLSLVRDVEVERGRVVVDRVTGRTTNPKYYAGGDCVNGGREVVDAVADGKRAALGIATALVTNAEPMHQVQERR
jgi:dihydropyrimidine dehydrogenase (NAD+) subunit PreT